MWLQILNMGGHITYLTRSENLKRKKEQKQHINKYMILITTFVQKCKTCEEYCCTDVTAAASALNRRNYLMNFN